MIKFYCLNYLHANVFFLHLKAARNVTGLQSEAGTQFDEMITSLLTTLQSLGDFVFATITKQFFPCFEAYEATVIATSTFCGSSGIINRITGYSYILALNILFIALLYFSVINLAFLQNVKAYYLAKIN